MIRLISGEAAFREADNPYSRPKRQRRGESRDGVSPNYAADYWGEFGERRKLSVHCSKRRLSNHKRVSVKCRRHFALRSAKIARNTSQIILLGPMSCMIIR